MKPLTTLPLLGWVLMQGLTSALKGPPILSAYLGRTLSVACQYEKGFQVYPKYWCKGSDWGSCTIVVQTDGTETEATSGRTSIQDNSTRSEFIVRLENFSQEDAGIYWCGIERVGVDLGFRIEITALPVLTSALKGPPKLSAYLGRTLSVACQYEEEYQTFDKFWCKGSDWGSCTVVVQTNGTETEVTFGRTLIQDNQTHSEFTVRLENFSQEDAGIYWCGIERIGDDLGFRIEITALPGLTSALKGPPKLSAFPGRTLSVACQYEERYRTYWKYWCKGSHWRSCTIVVQTDGRETEATSGRTSIRDNQTRSEFTVRLENFSQEDIGIYWCGITKTGSDPLFRIEITALPDPTLAENLPTTEQSAILPSVETAHEVLYQVNVALLISTGLKTAILLCLVFGLIWMRRSSST